MKFLNGLLGRAPFAFLGAMGIFSIVGNFMTLEENIYQTLEAWRSVTRPIWDFLLGWLFEWVGWKMNSHLKDYLTMATITTAALLRVQIYLRDHIKDVFTSKLANILFLGFTWPIVLTMSVPLLIYEGEYKDNNTLFVFFETFLYFLVLLAINYVFIFNGAPNMPPVSSTWV
ncbi:MAG: hypothetical protein AAFN79_12365 [Pseudomonadota bacterium]